MVLLTKVDELCDDTEQDTKNVYSSVKIRDKVFDTVRCIFRKHIYR